MTNPRQVPLRIAASVKSVSTYVVTLLQRAKSRASILLSDLAVPSTAGYDYYSMNFRTDDSPGYAF